MLIQCRIFARLTAKQYWLGNWLTMSYRFFESLTTIIDILITRDSRECDICSRRAHTDLVRACGRCQDSGGVLERVSLVPAPSWQLLGWLASLAVIVTTCLEIVIHT